MTPDQNPQEDPKHNCPSSKVTASQCSPRRGRVSDQRGSPSLAYWHWSPPTTAYQQDVPQKDCPCQPSGAQEAPVPSWPGPSPSRSCDSPFDTHIRTKFLPPFSSPSWDTFGHIGVGFSIQAGRLLVKQSLCLITQVVIIWTFSMGQLCSEHFASMSLILITSHY